MKKMILPVIIAAASVTAILLARPFSVRSIELSLLFLLGTGISFIDLWTKRVPARLLLALIVLRAGFLLFSDEILRDLLWSLGGALAMTLPTLLLTLLFEKLLKRRILGGGDLKLLFCYSLFFLWPVDLAALLLALALGAASRLIGTLIKKQRLREFPLAPYITLAWFAISFF